MRNLRSCTGIDCTQSALFFYSLANWSLVKNVLPICLGSQTNWLMAVNWIYPLRKETEEKSWNYHEVGQDRIVQGAQEGCEDCQPDHQTAVLQDR